MNMEDQILKIMLSKDDWDQDKGSTAKEITTHVMEFIEWKDDENINGIFVPSAKHGIYLNLCDSEPCTINDIYEYWLTEIKLK